MGYGVMSMPAIVVNEKVVSMGRVLMVTDVKKLPSNLPPVDGVVTMGCNVQCPLLPCPWRKDWGLDDPTGQPDAVFEETIRRIEENILRLRERLQSSRRG